MWAFLPLSHDFIFRSLNLPSLCDDDDMKTLHLRSFVAIVELKMMDVWEKDGKDCCSFKGVGGDAGWIA